MKKLLSLLLVLTLTISSASIFADTQTIPELKQQLNQYKTQLSELQKAIDEAEIDGDKAKVEMTDGLIKGGVTAIALDVAIPTILMGILFHGPQGNPLGIANAIKNIPTVLKMFYRTKIGIGFLAITTIGAVAYIAYKGRYYLSLDKDQLAKLQAEKNELEKKIDETLERILDLTKSVDEL